MVGRLERWGVPVEREPIKILFLEHLRNELLDSVVFRVISMLNKGNEVDVVPHVVIDLDVLGEVIAVLGEALELILADPADKAEVDDVVLLLVLFFSELTERIDDNSSSDLNDDNHEQDIL